MSDVDLDTADGPAMPAAMDVDLDISNSRAPGCHDTDGQLAFPASLPDGSLGVEYHPMCVHPCLQPG